MKVSSWVREEPTASQFAVPHGFLRGRLAGLIMLSANRQGEVVDLLDVRPGDRVLEVGYGPGGLVRLLLQRTDHVHGVDPSPEMRSFARLLGRRADLRVGTAESTGFPDESFDRVVSVNTVAIWPDLEAGLDELHRVLRPGGRLLLTWHGGSSPARRRLVLPEHLLDRLRRALEERFADVRRQELTRFVAFSAERRA